jgi:Flp pilus assembly protein TadG
MSKLPPRATKGQSLVEFGLIVMVLLLIVVGVIDLGRVIYSYSAIFNAAREGARYAILSDPESLDTAGITAAAKQHIVGLDPANVHVTMTTIPDSSDLDGDGDTDETLQIRVTVSTSFSASTPLTIPFLGSSNIITLRSSSTMRMEHTY